MNGLDNDKRLRTNRKMTVDQCLSIDIAQFDCHRDVSFSGELSWLNTHNDERILCVDYLFLPEDESEPMLILSYKLENRLVKETIIFQKTRTRFDGSRWWFTCPLCERRMGKLYLTPKGNYFACRRCHELRYSELVRL